MNMLVTRIILNHKEWLGNLIMKYHTKNLHL